MNTEPSLADQGEVVRKPRFRISVAWLFPILAVAAAGWLFWSNWRSEGPEIAIRFDTAPGLQAGKSLLIYRGVTAGKVTEIELDPSLDKVIVHIRLQAFAAELAREKTVFWIDRPTVSLIELSGLESIIQGNSVRARLGEGAPATIFEGREEPPLELLDAPSLIITLKTPSLPRVARGAPVYFHGVAVGAVSEVKLDEAGTPSLSAVINDPYGELVRGNARFWRLPGASISAGASGLKVDVPGLAALLQGGIEFDYFTTPGDAAKDGAAFDLFSTEAAARAISKPITISFDDGMGFIAGETPLRFLGLSIGLVESVTPNPQTGRVDVVARLDAGYERFLSAGTTFTLVKARLSTQGLTGLETLLRGIYIACTPGHGGPPTDHFLGQTPAEGWDSFEAEEGDLHLTLSAPGIPALGKGTPVLRRGVAVGRVIGKRFAANGSPVLDVTIRREFASAVRTNARFWRVAATSMDLGPGGVQFAVDGLATLLQGGVQFDVFGEPGSAATEGAEFSLFATEAAARATSEPIRISLEDGQGLVAGLTQLRFRGLPVGLVESVEQQKERVLVTARLEPGNERLTRVGSTFALVRPLISLRGVSGLETLVSGVYIDCVPGTGDATAREFVAQSQLVAEEKTKQADDADEGRLAIVIAANSTRIGEGAPVLYRGVPVGKVVRKALSHDAGKVDLSVEIDRAHASLIRENTEFWDIGGLKASLGFFYVKVDPAPLMTLTLGGIAFATPDDKEMGPRATSGSRFVLHEKPRSEWLKWSPTLPVPGAN